MFVDFCITLEENCVTSREELITFQHLVSQMLHCTLEETICHFVQTFFFQHYHLEDAACRRNKPAEAIIGIFRHTNLRLDEETSITVSTTIFQPRRAILTRVVFPRMDQEIKVFGFVPIILTVLFKLQ